jgi:hypothetical protein
MQVFLDAEGNERRGQLPGVVGINLKGSSPGQFGQGGGVAGDHGRAAGHGLQDGQTEAFVAGGEGEKGRSAVKCWLVGFIYPAAIRRGSGKKGVSFAGSSPAITRG